MQVGWKAGDSLLIFQHARWFYEGLKKFCRIDLPHYSFSDNTMFDKVLDGEVEVTPWR